MPKGRVIENSRNGWLKMPSLTKGYHMDPHEVLRSAKFQEEYSQMVIVKDIDFFSPFANITCCRSTERRTWLIFLMAISQG